MTRIMSFCAVSDRIGQFLGRVWQMNHPTLVGSLILVSPVCQSASWSEWALSKVVLSLSHQGTSRDLLSSCSPVLMKLFSRASIRMRAPVRVRCLLHVVYLFCVTLLGCKLLLGACCTPGYCAGLLVTQYMTCSSQYICCACLPTLH